jgi:hypothetical protein
MWLRAFGVAVALMAGCWAATVQAEQYVEVWNPPEVRQAPRHTKAVTPVGKRAVKTGSGSNRTKTQTLAGKHARGAAVAQKKAMPGAKLAQKSGGKAAVKFAGRETARSSSMASASKHLKTAASTGTNGKIKTAETKSTRKMTAARPKQQKLATRRAPAQPALTMDKLVSRASTVSTRSPAAPVAPVAPVITSAANSSVAGGGNLPPILH